MGTWFRFRVRCARPVRSASLEEAVRYQSIPASQAALTSLQEADPSLRAADSEACPPLPAQCCFSSPCPLLSLSPPGHKSCSVFDPAIMFSLRITCDITRHQYPRPLPSLPGDFLWLTHEVGDDGERLGRDSSAVAQTTLDHPSFPHWETESRQG